MKRKTYYIPLILTVTVVLTAFTIFLIIPQFFKKEKSSIAGESGENIFLQYENKTSQKFIRIPAICQYPGLPTGCESVAASMVLQYYGEDITAEEFAAVWLTCSDDFYTEGQREYGPDPKKVFVGNPFSKYSYGCYAGPIVTAVNEYSTKCRAKTIKNRSLEKLCQEYIDQDLPILIWATMGMEESEEGKSWYLVDNSLFTWKKGEHCLVLVGYDEEEYFLMDPQVGEMVSYKKEIVEMRYEEMGSQAVYIYR